MVTVGLPQSLSITLSRQYKELGLDVLMHYRLSP